MRRALLLLCVVGLSPAALADPLSYAEALARAGANAPSVAAKGHALDAARFSVRPAGQLPDPQLAVGLDNAPISGPDRYRLNRDEMTMLSVGVMQDVPSKPKRDARTALATAQAASAGAVLDLARLEARLGASRAWLDSYFAAKQIVALDAINADYAQLSEASTAAVGTASAAPGAALQARLEAAKIADRLSETRAMKAAADADLERWVGPLGGDAPGQDAPTFVLDVDHLRAHLDHHLDFATSAAEIQQAKAGLDLARADTHPDWGWQLMYAKRDPVFGDMVSLGLKFNLPLFQSTRQSPTIDARRADIARAGADRDAMLREHTAMLEARLATRTALTDRLNRADTVMLPLARQREAVVAAAHQAGTTPLGSAIEARIAVKEVQLDRLDLEHRLAVLNSVLSLEYEVAGHE